MTDEPSPLYHYCSNETFLKIISHREIWASDLTLSNDRMEGKWLKTVIDANREEIKDDDLLAQIEGLVESAAQTHTALGLCLSAYGDRLSQWRAYSDDGAGVSIGFDRESFGKYDLPPLVEVLYRAEEQRDLLKRMLTSHGPPLRQFETTMSRFRSPSLERHEMRGLQMQAHAAHQDRHRTEIAVGHDLYRIKNPAFEEEKEWRAIRIFKKPGAPAHVPFTYEAADPTSINYRARGDRIVPYFALKIEPAIIRNVILGPRNITPVSIVRDALKKHGLTDATVETSTASYRR